MIFVPQKTRPRSLCALVIQFVWDNFAFKRITNKKKEKRKVCLITCDNLNEMEKRTSRVLSNLHYLDIAFT